ncbi:hypothetical protein XENOCAPTIV_031038 [Xenoophorus captivus]|uniref:Uncharacterized protein n=1 Tax=Xenoophorus captivus TaxID=1517983 RepID=A0ABV0RW87_9TELE
MNPSRMQSTGSSSSLKRWRIKSCAQALKFISTAFKLSWVVQGNKTVWVIDIFLSASCQSLYHSVCFPEVKVAFIIPIIIYPAFKYFFVQPIPCQILLLVIRSRSCFNSVVLLFQLSVARLEGLAEGGALETPGETLSVRERRKETGGGWFHSLTGNPLKPDHMSGGGALQQRTTYLISLTLVKVEAVEENGGEAKKSTQEKEGEASQGRSPGEEVEAEAGVPALAENGAGVVRGEPQRGHEAKVDEFKGGERKHLSPQRDAIDDAGKAPEKPPRNLSIPLPAERGTIQQKKSSDVVESMQCQSPSLITTPPTELAEPSGTPTRTSLPIRPAGQRPVSLLKSHSSVATRGRDSREGRERSPTSAQSLDRKDCRVITRSPGPCRASWAEASRPEAWRDLRAEAQTGVSMDIGGGVTAVMRDIPRKDRLKTGSASLPAPANQVPKPARKGKSRTLDNSDLNSLSEDLGLAREGQQVQQGQRGCAKDRKMLKFISGIFTKSNSGAGGPTSTAPPVYIQRDSSEEEGRRSQTHHCHLYGSKPTFHEPPLVLSAGYYCRTSSEHRCRGIHLKQDRLKLGGVDLFKEPDTEGAYRL